MAKKFAERTKVPVVQTRNEIEKLLQKYGADKFMYGSEQGRAIVCFAMNNRNIKLELSIPDNDLQEERRLWRCLLIIIKAKLESVQSGVTLFEHEFMPYTVMPDGKTAAEHVEPAIENAYSSGKVVPLIPKF